MKEPGTLVVNIILHYCSTRVLLCVQMQKETEIEYTVSFFVAFLLLMAFQFWAPGLLGPSVGYAYHQRIRQAKCRKCLYYNDLTPILCNTDNALIPYTVLLVFLKLNLCITCTQSRSIISRGT